MVRRRPGAASERRLEAEGSRAGRGTVWSREGGIWHQRLGFWGVKPGLEEKASNRRFELELAGGGQGQIASGKWARGATPAGPGGALGRRSGGVAALNPRLTAGERSA